MSDKQKMQDELVQKAERLVSQLKAKGWSQDVGKTQASRAIEVAQASASLQLFVCWLRYQAARESDRQPFWSVKLGQQTLAEALTVELNAIQKNQANDPMKVVQLFLGYFRWALVGADFLDKIKVKVEG